MTRPIAAAILSCSGPCLSDEEKKLFAQTNPLGITLFGRNIENKSQLQSLTKEIREVIGRSDVIIAVDQEGGRVRRLNDASYIPYASQETLGKIAEEDGMLRAIRTVINQAVLIAHDLKEVGINFNYAPVLDIAYPETTAALKNRCFGHDEKQIALMGEIMMEEYVMQGICPCIKHIPGHGRANVDPHLNLPVINISLSELEKDMYPFRELNYAPAGMTAHIVIPEVDAELPVTQSKKAIDSLIRGHIGFKGFLLSDAIDMKALRGTLGEKASSSIAAGVDAVCYCLGDIFGLQEVTDHCGVLNDISLERLERIRHIIKVADIRRIAEEYKSMVNTHEKYDQEYDSTEVLNNMKKEK